jgi:hypothetical protein
VLCEEATVKQLSRRDAACGQSGGGRGARAVAVVGECGGFSPHAASRSGAPRSTRLSGEILVHHPPTALPSAKNARPPRTPACHRYRLWLLLLLLWPPPLPLSRIYPSVLIALKGFTSEGFGCLLGLCLVYSVI